MRRKTLDQSREFCFDTMSEIYTANTALNTNYSTIDQLIINQSIDQSTLLAPHNSNTMAQVNICPKHFNRKFYVAHPPANLLGWRRTNGVCLANVKHLDFPTGVHCIWSKLFRFNSVILVFSWVLLLHSFFYLKKY